MCRKNEIIAVGLLSAAVGIILALLLSGTFLPLCIALVLIVAGIALCKSGR